MPLTAISRKLLWLALPALILLLLFLLYPALLRSLGHLVVYEKTGFEKLDAVIVLSGWAPERVLHAADLLLANRAGIALLTRENPSRKDRLLKELGVRDLKSFEINRQVLLYKGIPPEQIKILPGTVASTWEEALAFRRYLKSSPLTSIGVVTSTFHSYRSYLNFESALKGTAVEVYSLPSPYSEFDPNSWWQDRDQIKTLSMEIPSLAAFFLRIR